MSEQNPDVRKQLNRAIINYNIEKGKDMKQEDVVPGASQSHINNVASGKSTNKKVRQTIEKFIKRWDL
jgi:hypothetical protein